MEMYREQVLYQGTRFDTRKDVKTDRYGNIPDRETGGVCPWCKNFVIKKTSKDKCRYCNALITW